MSCFNEGSNFHYRSFKNTRALKGKEAFKIETTESEDQLMNRIQELFPRKVRIVLDNDFEVRHHLRLAKVLFPFATIGSRIWDTRSSDDTHVIFYTLERALSNFPSEGTILIRSSPTPRTHLLILRAQILDRPYETAYSETDFTMNVDQSEKEILDLVAHSEYDFSDQSLVNNLVSRGYLSPEYELTEKGSVVAQLPLASLNLATMVYYAFIDYAETRDNSGTDIFTLQTAVAVAAMTEVGDNYFYIPDEIRNDHLAFGDLTRRVYDRKFRGETVVHTYANIYWDYVRERQIAESYDLRVKGRDRYSYLLDWATNNYIMYETFQNANLLIDDLLETLGYRFNITFMNQMMSYEIQSIGGLALYGSRCADLFRRSFTNSTFNRVLIPVNETDEIWYERDGEYYAVNLDTAFNKELYPDFVFGYVNPVTKRLDVYVGNLELEADDELPEESELPTLELEDAMEEILTSDFFNSANQ